MLIIINSLCFSHAPLFKIRVRTPNSLQRYNFFFIYASKSTKKEHFYLSLSFFQQSSPTFFLSNTPSFSSISPEMQIFVKLVENHYAFT